MKVDEAIDAIRHARAAWAIPTFLQSEAVATCADILLDERASARDRLRAVETLVAIERLAIDLKGINGEPEAGRTLNVVNINLSLEDWRVIRDRKITVQEYLSELEGRALGVISADHGAPAPPQTPPSTLTNGAA